MYTKTINPIMGDGDFNVGEGNVDDNMNAEIDENYENVEDNEDCHGRLWLE